MNWTVYIESLGERPEADLTAVEAGRARRETRDAAEQQADRARDVAILAAMQSYDGPLNRKGRPRCARSGDTWRITTWAISRGPNATNCTETASNDCYGQEYWRYGRWVFRLRQLR